jgi:hypothetical protein
MKPPGKECVTIRSALAVVSVNPPSEEHYVLRTCLLVGPAVSERLCSRGEVRSSGKMLRCQVPFMRQWYMYTQPVGLQRKVMREKQSYGVVC